MCGISGIYHPDDHINKLRLVRSMTDGITHRGPDEDGFYEDGEISLGMRRLKVIDLVTGSQPISNEDGSVVIVFNGEIYRYEAIRENLQTKGHIFKTLSDTEVLIHLYEEYDVGLFDHIDGMFAF